MRKFSILYAFRKYPHPRETDVTMIFMDSRPGMVNGDQEQRSMGNEMNKQMYTLLAQLVAEHPMQEPEPGTALAAARDLLASRQEPTPRGLAEDALAALDALLQSLEGGVAFDALLDARQALLKYVQQIPPKPGTLAVRSYSTGGVTLLRDGQHFTISDSELDEVRETINVRKRELRKRQRRA